MSNRCGYDVANQLPWAISLKRKMTLARTLYGEHWGWNVWRMRSNNWHNERVVHLYDFECDFSMKLWSMTFHTLDIDTLLAPCCYRPRQHSSRAGRREELREKKIRLESPRQIDTWYSSIHFDFPLLYRRYPRTISYNQRSSYVSLRPEIVQRALRIGDTWGEYFLFNNRINKFFVKFSLINFTCDKAPDVPEADAPCELSDCSV